MTVTDEGAALLAAVLDSPGCDTVRLVYADWLQENGDPERAEFIRVQCELDKGAQFETHGCDVCGNTPDEEGVIEHGEGCYTQHEDGGGTSYADYTARYYSLLERERTLFVEHRCSWFPVPTPHGLDWDIRLTSPFSDERPAYVVRRGFVESVTCTAETWLRHADALTASHPITAVTLTTTPRVEWDEIIRQGGRQCWFANHPGPRKTVWVDALRWPEFARNRIVSELLKCYWPRVAFTVSW